jgi:hypothetical protein
MKTPLTLLAALLFSAAAPAQDCSGYFFAQAGTDVEMTSLDRKGSPAGRVTYHVKEARKSGNSLDAVLTTVAYDEKGKELAAARDLTLQCRNGTYLMDMKNFVMPETMSAFKNSEVKFSGSMVEYPAALAEGTALPDAEFLMEPSAMPMMKTTVTLSNRKVVGKESVSTPAGSFESYKITYDASVKSLVGFKYQVTEWFRPGFGLIKSETYRNGKLMGSTVLSKYGKR